MLNLKANTKPQELILDFLNNNISGILAEKINNGVKIEKDGKTLVNKKDLDGFMKYAAEEARKLSDKSANSACVEDSVVYGWAIHYFEEDSIEGKLYNTDGSEYKPVIKPKTNQKSTYTPVSAPVKPNPQTTLFDLLSETDEKHEEVEKPEEPEKQKPTLDEILEYNIDDDHDEDEDDEEEENETEEDIEAETKDEEQKPNKPVSTIYTEYSELCKKYPDRAVAIKLGDFYEIFGKKAVSVANKLDLTLKSRDFGLDQRIPMIGFPYHASDMYFKKILALFPLAVAETDETVRLIDGETPQNIDEETGEILTAEAEDKELIKSFDKTVLYSIIDLFNNELTIE